MSRTPLAILLAALLCAAGIASPAAGADEPLDGWFFGVGLSLFELSGTGEASTSSGNLDFGIERNNAYGLITNQYTSPGDELGFGWENSQLPGVTLNIGFRHNFHYTTHLDLFFALPKSAEQRGYPNPDATDYEYLHTQSTRWTQSSVRLMVDWTPFEPLPLWYFTAGLEYASFDSRIETVWEGVQAGLPVYRRFENYEDGGGAVGGVIGTGLQMSNAENRRVQWYVQLKYSFVPFNDTFYAWETDILIGGVALEAGAKFYMASEK